MHQKNPLKMAILGIFGYVRHTYFSLIVLILLIKLPLGEPHTQKNFKTFEKILVPEKWPKLAKNLVVS